MAELEGSRLSMARLLLSGETASSTAGPGRDGFPRLWQRHRVVFGLFCSLLTGYLRL